MNCNICGNPSVLCSCNKIGTYSPQYPAWPFTRERSLKELLEQETELMNQLARSKQIQKEMQEEFDLRNKQENNTQKHLSEALKETRSKLKNYFENKELGNLLGKDE